MATRPAALLPLLTQAPPPTGDRGPVTDRDLLRRFARDRDEPAFAVLVRRHASMVLGVCRRVLGNPADAEDACQATFLVLTRKAGSGRWRASIASWLYATARQVALNARTARARRAKHEGRAAARAPVNPLAEITGEELLAILDEELGKLPERYRAPVVLCCVEGLTRDEAAQQLGVPAATLKGQLERGRKRLHDALARRGVALGAGLLALAATAPVGAASARAVNMVVGNLGRGVAAGGVGAKAVLLAVAVAGVSVLGLGAVSPPAGGPKEPAKTAAKPAAPPAKAEEKPGRVVAGRVVGPEDKPVAGASVFAFEAAGAAGSQETETVRSVSGPDGRFRITLPAGKRFATRLYATAAGFGVDRFEYPEAGTDDLTIRLVADHPIAGRVVSTEGKAVAGVQLSIDRIADDVDDLDKLLARAEAEDAREGIGHRRSMPTNRAEFRTTAVTGADGKFKLAGGGKDRVVYVRVLGDGIVSSRLTVINRPGFDPEPFNAALRKAGNRFDGRLVLHGPELNIVAEREKLIRGRVTDSATGEPRAGVQVLLTRSRSDLLWPIPEARTDKDGRYEIRGARKAKGYMVEVGADTTAGYMPCQGWADDTTGYEPVTLDLRTRKGVVVTGRLIDGGTGKPVPGWALIGVPQGNPSVKDYPEFDASAWFPMQQTNAAGRFRVVAIPGPVLLFGQPNNADFLKYKPPAADPKYPQFFKMLGDHTAYFAPGGAMTPLQGRYCKVLEIPAGAKEVEHDIVLEPVEPPKKGEPKK